MHHRDILNYVTAAASLAGVPLDAARAEAVAVHFARTIAIAKVLEGALLAPEHEPAAIYCPAPFPDHEAVS